MHLSFKAFVETKAQEEAKDKENAELRDTVKKLEESDKRNREMLEQLIRSGNFKPVEKKEDAESEGV